MNMIYDNVVVGGSGFIGSSLIAALRNKGETIACVSREVGSAIPGVDVFLLDVSTINRLQDRFPQGDTVFILIGQTGAGFNPEKELLNLKNIIQVVNKNIPKRVFYLSSVRVYGETVAPATEDYALYPYDEYSRFKCDAEALLRKMLDPSIFLALIRLSNVYGNSKNKGFINTLMLRAVEASVEDLIVHGDGTQSLDYVHVDDVADALVSIKEKINENDSINIATGENHSVIDLITLVSRISGKALLYSVEKNRQIAVQMSSVSNKKLREKYEFTPRIMLEAGLRKTLDTYIAPLPPKRKRILLLGGEGFIGRNLAEQMSGESDCFSVGKEKSLWGDRKDIFIQLDAYRDVVADSFDAVVHLIDNAISLQAFEEAEKKLLSNIHLQEKTHLVLISSSVLYAQPESEYALRKELLEKTYAEYCALHSIPLTILRLFNVYGPYQYPGRAGSLVANIFMAYLLNKKIQIRDMNASRDFIHVRDVARVIEDCIKRTVTGTFDLGTGELTSIASLVGIIEQDVIHARLDIELKGIAESFVCPSAKNHVGLTAASTSLEEGLQYTFAFYLKNKEKFYA